MQTRVLSKLEPDSETSSKYSLCSIEIHYGGINGGHCTSEVCIKDNWGI